MVSSLETKAANKGWVNGKDGLVEASVMDAEELTFPDNMFTHSYTNLGILFLKKPGEGGIAYLPHSAAWRDSFCNDLIRNWGTCHLCAGRRKPSGPTALLGNYR
jgi:hypothetical protein